MRHSFIMIYAIFLRQLFLLKHSIPRWVGIFYWATLEIVLWGFITIYLSTLGESKFSFFTALLGAPILWNFLLRVQMGLTMGFMEDIWTRNLINLFSSPLTMRHYLAGLILVSIFQASIAIGLMALIAWFLFSYNIFTLGFALLPFVAVLFMFGWALGVWTVAIIMALGPSAEVLAWSLPALFTPFSGVFYPISSLPAAIQPFAYLLPSSYVFEGFRSIVISGTFDIVPLYKGFLLAFIMLVAAYFFSIACYRYVIQHGLFSRFLTE